MAQMEIIIYFLNFFLIFWFVDHFWVLIPDIMLVMIFEFLVDWVKHAFITKFNEIPSEVNCDLLLTSQQIRMRYEHTHTHRHTLTLIPTCTHIPFKLFYYNVG